MSDIPHYGDETTIYMELVKFYSARSRLNPSDRSRLITMEIPLQNRMAEFLKYMAKIDLVQDLILEVKLKIVDPKMVH